MIKEIITESVNLVEILPSLKEMSKRPPFAAKVAMVDNVPPVEGSVEHTKLCTSLKEALGVEWVGQDRFHAMHSMTPLFNNQDPRFFPYAIVAVCNRLIVRAEDDEARVDRMLQDGQNGDLW